MSILTSNMTIHCKRELLPNLIFLPRTILFRKFGFKSILTLKVNLKMFNSKS